MKIRDAVKKERAAVVTKNNPSVLRLKGVGGLLSLDPREFSFLNLTNLDDSYEFINYKMDIDS